MMANVFKPTENFVVTNKKAGGQPQPNKTFQCPRLPWALRKGDRIESCNGRRFLLQNASGSLKYMGSDGKLGDFAALYYKEEKKFEYDAACEQTVRQKLDNVVDSMCGEYLGWFETPKMLAAFVDKAVRESHRKELKEWVREGIRESIELRITLDANGGVRFDMVRIPRHGGHDSTLMADSVPA